MKLKEKIDVVKIDVEGFEINVIKGMRRILQKDKHVLWIEIFEENKAEMDKILSECGYKQIDKISNANYIFACGGKNNA